MGEKPRRVGYDSDTGTIIPNSPRGSGDYKRVLLDSGPIAAQNSGAIDHEHEYVDPPEQLEVRPEIMLRCDDVDDRIDEDPL